MADILLRINGDGSQLARALGASVNAVQQAQVAMTVAARKGTDARIALEMRAQKAIRDAGKETVRQAVREHALRRSLERDFARNVESAHKRATSIVAAESKTRGKALKDEEHAARILAQGIIESRRRAESAATDVAQRGSRARIQAARDEERAVGSARRASGGGGGGGRRNVAPATPGDGGGAAPPGRRRLSRAGSLGFVTGAADSVAEGAVGAVGSAQEVAADRQTAVRRALGQVTGDVESSARIDEMNAVEQRIIAFAAEHRMDSTEIARGMLTAQSRTSMLAAREGMNPDQARAHRQRAVEASLRDADLATATGEDVGEVMRVGGMIRGQLGLDPEAAEDLLHRMVALAREGSVELSDIGETGLRGLMANVNSSMAGRTFASEAERQRAVSAAVAHTYGTAQLLSGAGLSVNDSQGALNKIRQNAQDDTTTERLYQTLHARRSRDANARAATEGPNSMFVTAQDAQGRNVHRLNRRYYENEQGATELIQRVFEANGRNSLQTVNMLRRGDEGTILDSQVRRTVLAGLGDSGDGTGQTRFEKLRTFQNANLSESDIRGGRAAYASSIQAMLIARQEEQTRAVLANTEAVRAANAVQQFRAENPWMSQIADAVPGGRLALTAASWLSDLVNGSGDDNARRSGVAENRGFRPDAPGNVTISSEQMREWAAENARAVQEALQDRQTGGVDAQTRAAIALSHANSGRNLE